MKALFTPTPEQQKDVDRLKQLWEKFRDEEELDVAMDYGPFQGWLERKAPMLAKKYFVGPTGGIEIHAAAQTK